MAQMSSSWQRLTWLPAAGTLLSIFSCKGTLGIVTGLSLMGITLHINVHVWAAAIVAFAVSRNLTEAQPFQHSLLVLNEVEPCRSFMSLFP